MCVCAYVCSCMYVCCVCSSSSSSGSGSGSGMIADQYETEEDTVWAPVMGEARAVKHSYPKDEASPLA